MKALDYDVSVSAFPVSKSIVKVSERTTQNVGKVTGCHKRIKISIPRNANTMPTVAYT